MRKRKLPTGVQTFRRIREDGGYYVDKTAYIRRLVAEGTHYFLSRPRRFGKSLLLDTIKELFEGSKRCSPAFTFTSTGIGTRASRWCGSISAAATTWTRIGRRKI